MKKLLLAAAVLALSGAASAQTATAPSAPSAYTAPNYDDGANWLCRPGRTGDACDVDLTATIVRANGTVEAQPFHAAQNPPVDCFYVYPTVSADPGDNSDMTPNDEERRVIASQFSRFREVCRPFAPMYRQVTLTALRRMMAGGNNADMSAWITAYADVHAAFRHYMEHDNNGRRFVLVGHSQGSRMLQLLIEREIDGKPIQQQMLSAMLMGFNTEVPTGGDVGGQFQHVPLCKSPTQTGCVISYVSFRADAPPPANSRFGVTTTAGRQVACTNPADLANNSDAPLDAVLGARGAGQSSRPPPAWVNNGQAVTTGFVRVPGLLTGRCVTDAHGTYFAITVHPDPADPRTDVIVGDIMVGDRVLADWGLHLLDVSEAQGNLIGLVRSQSAAAH